MVMSDGMEGIRFQGITKTSGMNSKCFVLQEREVKGGKRVKKRGGKSIRRRTRKKMKKEKKNTP